jgi:hypothetical protein
MSFGQNFWRVSAKNCFWRDKNDDATRHLWRGKSLERAYSYWSLSPLVSPLSSPLVSPLSSRLSSHISSLVHLGSRRRLATHLLACLGSHSSWRRRLLSARLASLCSRQANYDEFRPKCDEFRPKFMTARWVNNWQRVNKWWRVNNWRWRSTTFLELS